MSIFESLSALGECRWIKCHGRHSETRREGGREGGRERRERELEGEDHTATQKKTVVVKRRK